MSAISLSGADYTQDFNSLANSGTASTVLPSGWEFLESGSSADTAYGINDGTSGAGNTYSYGSSGSSDRALGGLLSDSVVPTIGVSFTNNTGNPINFLTFSYRGEQWQLGTANRTDGFNFQYSLDATSLSTGTWTDFDLLDYVAPTTSGIVGALNGNDVSNSTLVTGTLSGLNIANGATFYLRWLDFDAVGQDDALAIDDFSLSTAVETITVAQNAANPAQTDINSSAGTSSTDTNSANLLAIAGSAVPEPTIFNLNSVGTGFRADLAVTGSGYTSGDVVNLNANPNPNDFTIDQVQQINVAANTALTTRDRDPANTLDIGDVNWTAGQQIVFSSGSSLSTAGDDPQGKITLAAQGLSGTGTGISLTNASLTANSGDIALTGKGNAGVNTSVGISLNANSVISSTGTGASAAAITVTGYGSTTATGAENDGVDITGTGSKITAVDGAITIAGTGGNGTGFNAGVVLLDSGAIASSGTGAIDISGTGGSGADSNIGVLIFSQGSISSTGTGASAATVTVNGEGSASATGNYNYGVNVLGAGSQITAVDGAIAVTGTGGSGAGSNSGVMIGNAGAISSTGTGASAATVAVTGYGSAATTGNYNHGIGIGGGEITSMNGAITVTGIGGSGTDTNNGVAVSNSGTISSTGTGASAASITITGVGSASATGTGNDGVNVAGSGSNVASVDGAIAVTGVGGNGSGFNAGVVVLNSGAVSSSGTGAIEVTGTGGKGADSNIGVLLYSGGAISSTKTGTDAAPITITGKGSATATGKSNYGVDIDGTGSKITSVSGAIAITGTGGGGTDSNYGVVLLNSGAIASTGTGTGAATITVNGQGSTTATGSYNYGVDLEGTGSQINSIDGTIAITGTGGSGTASNNGVVVLNSAAVSSTGTGAITVSGKGGSGTDSNNGIVIADAGAISSAGTGATAAAITLTGEGSVSATGSYNYGIGIGGVGSKITSIDGAIAITGKGGSGTDSNTGVVLFSGGTVSSTGTGATAAKVTLTGQGSASSTGANNEGVRIDGTNSQITSITGAILIQGTGGSGTDQNAGVFVRDGARVASTGTGVNAAKITITGQGGGSTATGSVNQGVRLSSTAKIESVDGAIAISGTGRDGLDSNSGISLATGASIRSTGTGTVTLTGTAGSGSASDGIRLEGGSRIQSNSGAINLTGTASAANFGIHLLDNAAISSTTGQITLSASAINLGDTSQITTGDKIYLNSDTDAAVGVTDLGTTVNMTAAAVLINDVLNVNYNASVNRFDTLNLTGAVDLGGSTLQVDLTQHTSSEANPFYTLINNDGTDAVIGTFTGLAEGARVGLNGNYEFFITYQGDAANPGLANIGTGNDVQLYAVNLAPTDISLTTSSIGENAAANSVIGTFSSVAPKAGTSFTYSLAAGTGDTDNAAFTISGNELKINASPDFEAKSSYSIRVQTTDSDGFSYEKTLAISVQDLNDAPVLTAPIPDQQATTGTALSFTLPANTFTDADAGDSLILSAALADGSALPAWLSFNPLISKLSGTPTAGDVDSIDIQIKATDGAGVGVSDIFRLTLQPLSNTSDGNTTDGNSITPKGIPGENGTTTGQTGTATATISFVRQPLSIVAKGKTGIALLKGGRFNDRLQGGTGNERLQGGAGNDLLYGNAGNDRLSGNQGNDLLHGGIGDDRLEGSAGDDILVGDAGKDILIGGAGKDMFVFNALNEGIDEIQGFEAGQDVIDLRSILSRSEFSSASSFDQYQKYIQLVQVGANSEVRVDVDGNGQGTIFVTLARLQNLSTAALGSTNFVI